MSRYLVFFEETATAWRLNRAELMARLLQDWPAAELVPAEEMGVTPMRDVGWTYAADGADVEGWSAASGVGISLDGDDDLALRFAAWYRRMVPDDVPVTLAGDMGVFSFEIPAGASAEDVIGLYNEP
jgi:hypothetical protein